jgi:hypothetical protein
LPVDEEDDIARYACASDSLDSICVFTASNRNQLSESQYRAFRFKNNCHDRRMAKKLPFTPYKLLDSPPLLPFPNNGADAFTVATNGLSKSECMARKIFTLEKIRHIIVPMRHKILYFAKNL